MDVILRPDRAPGHPDDGGAVHVLRALKNQVGVADGGEGPTPTGGDSHAPTRQTAQSRIKHPALSKWAYVSPYISERNQQLIPLFLRPTATTIANMPIPSDLKFDAGTPPPQWLELSTTVNIRGLILHLWEMTMGLIHNEKALSRDRRFLAMAAEHRVSIRNPFEMV